LAHDVVVTGSDGALEPWWNTYDEELHQRARALLSQLGIGHLDGRPLASLSEGERTTVMLARVLMAEPKMILLDEPATGLDLGARERLMVLLDDLANTGGPPRVMVSHHLEELPASTTHALIMKAGGVLAQGPARDVMTSDVISEAFEVHVTVVRSEHGRYFVQASR
jgi:iron complex transport system ATP-binding protein